ncbi:MAG: ABC transporter permease subunit [Planctomycetes bacterium]|nr:ABC transporter permease subunit [Planctomycetota bacterium]
MTEACPTPLRGPRRFGPWWIAALAVASMAALSWNLEALSGWNGFAAAWDRLRTYVGAFTAPDLSWPMLALCSTLTLETLSVAVLGVACGLMLGYPLALGACRCLVVGEEPAPRPVRWLQVGVLEACRFTLDVLRGVPDIAWAIVLANLTGVNAITGVLAIGISTAGIFGKVLSEQWDNVDPARYAAVRSSGATRSQTFFYAVQPLAARATLSFLLMRTECAVRNASVIGVVGGGGLGAQLWDEYTDGSWSRVATVLLALLAVTATTDLVSNLVRQRLRVDPNHPRRQGAIDRSRQGWRRVQVLGSVLALVAAAAWSLTPAMVAVAAELQRIDWEFAAPYTLGLFTPDLSPAALGSALRHAVVPVAIGLLATVAGAALAALLVYPASVAFQLEPHRFLGENPPTHTRILRGLALVATRGLALVWRGVPEVAWVIVLAVFFRMGVTPCVLAVALHSAGVLHRVFTETVDNLDYRRLERTGGTCRAQVFMYGALPRVWPDWRTYAFFQFEVNVRLGIALGVVGAGGLGHMFKMNLDWRQHGGAATYLWAMIVLTIAIDRLSRWLQLTRLRC